MSKALREKFLVLVKLRSFLPDSPWRADGWDGHLRCPVCQGWHVVLPETRKVYCVCGAAVLLVDRPAG